MERKTSVHGEIEPDVVEPKPKWADVPKDLVREIESCFSSSIVKANVLWGGYTPSATFEIEFKNGKKVFCKATHRGNTAWGQKAFALELQNFEQKAVPAQLSPAFLGSVKTDSWNAAFFELIDDRVPVPPWKTSHAEELIAKLKILHLFTSNDFPNQVHAFDHELTGSIYRGEEGWADMAHHADSIDGFCHLFEEPASARLWWDKNISSLASIEKSGLNLNWKSGLIHQDLRSDNILFSQSRGPLIVDWPYLAIGPLAMDFVFLLPSVAGEGGPAPVEMLKIYEDETGTHFSDQEIQTAAVMTAGFFASGAHQPPIPGLPRIRWIQRLQLFPALRWMCEIMDIKPPSTLPKRSF